MPNERYFGITSFLFSFFSFLLVFGLAHALTWSPPTLATGYTTVAVGGYGPTLSEYWVITAACPTCDTVVKWSSPTHRRVIFRGGRNWVIRGGEVINDVLWTNLNNRGGIEFQSVQGIAYVEGLWIHGQVDPNPDSTNWYGIDGIRLGTGSSNTTLIVQNTRIEDRTGAQSPQAAHADCIQCFGGVKELRIDTVTCRSQFQGLMFKQEVGTYFGPSDIRRMDFANVPQRYRAGYLLNLVFTFPTQPVTFSQVYLDPTKAKPNAMLDRDFCVAAILSTGRTCTGIKPNRQLTWIGAPIQVNGFVSEGAPTGGDFVPVGVAGINYQIPTPSTTPPIASTTQLVTTTALATTTIEQTTTIVQTTTPLQTTTVPVETTTLPVETTTPLETTSLPVETTTAAIETTAASTTTTTVDVTTETTTTPIETTSDLPTTTSSVAETTTPIETTDSSTPTTTTESVPTTETPTTIELTTSSGATETPSDVATTTDQPTSSMSPTPQRTTDSPTPEPTTDSPTSTTTATSKPISTPPRLHGHLAVRGQVNCVTDVRKNFSAWTVALNLPSNSLHLAKEEQCPNAKRQTSTSKSVYVTIKGDTTGDETYRLGDYLTANGGTDFRAPEVVLAPSSKQKFPLLWIIIGAILCFVVLVALVALIVLIILHKKKTAYWGDDSAYIIYHEDSQHLLRPVNPLVERGGFIREQ